MSKQETKRMAESVRRTAIENSTMPNMVAVERSQSVSFTAHEGPIPPPETLGGYERIQPGLAVRIIEMAEREQAARLEDRRIARQAHGKHLQRTTYSALTVALTGFGVTAFLGFLGHPAAAAIVGSLEVASMVGAFLYARHPRSQKQTDTQE